MSFSWLYAKRLCGIGPKRFDVAPSGEPAAASNTAGDEWPQQLSLDEISRLQFPDGRTPRRETLHGRRAMVETMRRAIDCGALKATTVTRSEQTFSVRKITTSARGSWADEFHMERVATGAVVRTTFIVRCADFVTWLSLSPGVAPGEHLAAWIAAVCSPPIKRTEAPGLTLVSDNPEPAIIGTKQALLDRFGDAYPALASALKKPSLYAWVAAAKRGRNRYDFDVIKAGCLATWAADAPVSTVQTSAHIPFGANVKVNRCR
ncbi:hypothetical protein OPU71_07040 [Niveibacterium sp. 24ML]|uniref:hypothetical protein n=1 Tax=Niveibacterium sp. 24ML TaxID=2985512 RepID=UPI00226E6B11|nr:hypothetical protein [Niveibacterium sp. 24ML]MCX9155883.1 hypothetical protein [Niveibacterium sp. 24ML]